MSLSNISLKNKKHGLIAMKQDLVLMRVVVLGRDSMLSHVGSIDDTKTVLDQDRFV